VNSVARTGAWRDSVPQGSRIIFHPRRAPYHSSGTSELSGCPLHQGATAGGVHYPLAPAGSQMVCLIPALDPQCSWRRNTSLKSRASMPCRAKGLDDYCDGEDFASCMFTSVFTLEGLAQPVFRVLLASCRQLQVQLISSARCATATKWWWGEVKGAV
jgi:hypothetical protein